MFFCQICSNPKRSNQLKGSSVVILSLHLCVRVGRFSTFPQILKYVHLAYDQKKIFYFLFSLPNIALLQKMMVGHLAFDCESLLNYLSFIDCTNFFNLQNHPTFHPEERLVRLVRGRECFNGLSILFLYGGIGDWPGRLAAPGECAAFPRLLRGRPLLRHQRAHRPQGQPRVLGQGPGLTLRRHILPQTGDRLLVDSI